MIQNLNSHWYHLFSSQNVVDLFHFSRRKKSCKPRTQEHITKEKTKDDIIIQEEIPKELTKEETLLMRR